MEVWLVIIVTACIAAFLKSLISLVSQSNSKYPPGPLEVPIISTIQWLRRSSTESEAALRNLRSRFGPIFTVRNGVQPMIFISSTSLAHEALVQKGAIFADRPKAQPVMKILTSNQHNINSARYGSTWRVLRRNLTSRFLHPSKVKDFSHASKWVLDILINNLNKAKTDNEGHVKVVDHFRFSIFCLLVLICFGEKLDESQIKEIDYAQHQRLISFSKVAILNFWPRVTRVLLPGRWNLLQSIMKKQREIMIPLIQARKVRNENKVFSYADSLLTLEIQDEDDKEKRRLSEEEMVTLCSEFLNAGTDTTSTALQWIMANLVKYPNIQAKLFEEIKGVVEANDATEVGEEDLSEMSYLKAVVLEGLRRHPPAHFLTPHRVTQEVELGGYTIPLNADVNFTVAEMGWDPKVWDDPMQFKPERFLSNDEVVDQEWFDITGSREIKMMPFGAGRRICPGLGLAILHLEYFVANLVWKFEWEAVDEVDLSEKQEFTTVMKHPLHARISPRPKN